MCASVSSFVLWGHNMRIGEVVRTGINTRKVIEQTECHINITYFYPHFTEFELKLGRHYRRACG